jgi:hypothetical protein
MDEVVLYGTGRGYALPKEEAFATGLEQGNWHLGIMAVAGTILYILLYVLGKYDLAAMVFIAMVAAFTIDMYIHGYMH